MERQDSFAADTNLPASFHAVGANDYAHSGYDRGHLCPSADRTDSTNDNDLTFLMSNMMPQTSDNNSGVWNNFEGYCRGLALSTNNYELLIICGPSGFNGARINTNGYVWIPQYTWKIAVVVPPGAGAATNRITGTNRVIVIKVPNTNGVSSTWQNFITSAAEIEVDTGLTFFTALPTNVAAALRNKVDGQTNPPPVIFAFAPTTNAANLSVIGLTRGSGVKQSGTAGTNGWGGTGFTNLTSATAIASNQFVTFGITVSNGYKVSFTSISRFDYYRSPSGATNALVQFQVGTAAFTDITNLTYPTTSAGGTNSPIDLSGFAALQDVGATTNVTFRIVNYGGTSSAGTWYVFNTLGTTAPDLAVQGTVTQVLTTNAPAI